jgi:hypothetical protein
MREYHCSTVIFERDNLWSDHGFVTIVTPNAPIKKKLEQQRCSVSQERCSIEQQSRWRKP